VSDPPCFKARPPRGRPGGSLTPRCWCRDHGRMCERSARHVQDSYRVRTRGRSRVDCTTILTHIPRRYSRCFAITSSASRCAWRRQGSALRSDPPCPRRVCGPTGLDDASAQLGGCTYVMAEEARCRFGIDRSGRQTYRERLDGAITHLLRVRNIRRGALPPPPSGQRCSFPQQQRSRSRAMTARDHRV
jgi:hypothetical protein